MANDVSVAISGSLPITAIGVEIIYGVNSIPLCNVTMDPTDSKILEDPDSYKRQELINISITVKDQTVRFTGYFDGISVSQSFGGLSYSAVFKGQQQLLLECDITVPGISPYGVNPFAPVNKFKFNGQQLDQKDIVAFDLPGASDTFDGMSIAEIYLEIANSSISYQTDPDSWSQLIATDPTLEASVTPLTQVISNGGRVAKLQTVANYLSSTGGNVDITAMVNLVDGILGSQINVVNGILEQYLNGPQNVWENMVSYFSTLGAILICSNSQILIVPDNGFITTPNVVPSVGGGSEGLINAAYPANYNSFSYSDNGYVDVGYVAVITDYNVGQDYSLSLPAYQGGYPKNGQSSFAAGTALLIVTASPLIGMVSARSTNSANFSAQATPHQPNKPTNITSTDGSLKMEVPQSTASDNSDYCTQQYLDAIEKFGDNYAEIMFYKAHYGDRAGNINLEFNPNWCPGTVGYLYTRQPGVFIDFQVQRVRHSVSLAAPNQGVAYTTVDFNCGRMGTNPPSVASDALYDYGYSQVQEVQSKFVSDISG